MSKDTDNTSLQERSMKYGKKLTLACPKILKRRKKRKTIQTIAKLSVWHVNVFKPHQQS